MTEKCVKLEEKLSEEFLPFSRNAPPCEAQRGPTFHTEKVETTGGGE